MTSGSNPARPLPCSTPISAPFWEACQRGELIVQRCRACQSYIFIPQAFCRFCLSTDLEWVPSAGRGNLVSFTVVWRPQTPAFEIPYVIGVVGLDEGYEMMSNLVGCEIDDVSIGMPLKVEFVRVVPEFVLPCYAPLG